MMSRNDYQLIAMAIKDARPGGIADYDDPQTVVDNVAHTVARALAIANPRFRATRFLEACGVLKLDMREVLE